MTEIFLENKYRLSVKEGVSFPLNFNIQNLLDVSSIPSSYSKNITLAGTKENNKILGSLFSINYSNGNFNQYQKVDCSVYQDGIPVFTNSTLELISFSKTGANTYLEGDNIEYVVRIVSELTTFFSEIKSKIFDDFDFEPYGDTNPFIVQEGSNNQYAVNTIPNNFYYYLYYYITGNTFKIENVIPSLMLKSLFDKIHDDVDFKYNIVNKEDIRFDNLILPAHTKFREDLSLNKKASFIYEYSYYLPNPFLSVQANFGEELRDSNKIRTNLLNLLPSESSAGVEKSYVKNNFYDSFNFSIKRYDVLNSFKHTFKLSYEYYNFIDVTDVIPSLEGFVTVRGIPGTPRVKYLEKRTYMSLKVNGGSGAPTIPGKTAPTTYNFPYTKSTIDVFTFGSGSPDTFGRYDTSTFGADFGYKEEEVELDLIKGDYVELFNTTEFVFLDASNNIISVGGGNYVFMSGANPLTNYDFYVNSIIPEFNFSITPSIDKHVGNIPLNFSSYYDNKLTWADIIKSTCKLFNILVYTDEEEGLISYETRDSFFDRGKKVNWSDKLDKSKPISVEFLRTKQKRFYLLSYKEDKDIFNREYQDSTDKIYGQLRYDFDTNVNAETQTLNTIFSSTPIYYSEAGQSYLMALESPMTSETVNPRILYLPKDKDGIPFQQQTNFKYETEAIYIADNIEIPYVGHLDDPVNPTFDLNFEQPDAYFYDKLENYNDVNLYNKFHRRSIQQLKDGKIMVAFFNLTPTDIQNFKFNDKIFVNDSWWNINKIIDYDANSNSVTKVELISVDDELKLY